MASRIGLIAALLAGALLLVALQKHGSPAHAEPATDITFQGQAGGGTISITFTTDRVGVRRVGLRDVQFLPAETNGCNATTVTAVRHFDPPAPVRADGSFFARLLPVGASTFVDKVGVGGQLTPTGVEGTAAYSAATGAPEVGCASAPLAWTLSGPVETPPGPDDLPFAGSIRGYSGTIALTLTPDASAITSIELRSLMAPCVVEGAGLDARDFFDPPVQLDPKTHVFEVTLTFSGSDNGFIRRIILRGRLVDRYSIEGTFEYVQIVQYCTGEGTWSAAAGLVPTPMVSATSTPAAIPTPLPTASLSGLPETGSQTREDTLALPLLSLELVVVAVFSLGLAVRRR